MKKFLLALMVSFLILTSVSDSVVFAMGEKNPPVQESESSEDVQDLSHKDEASPLQASDQVETDSPAGLDSPPGSDAQDTKQKAVSYSVAFKNWDDTPLAEVQTVLYGEAAIAPDIPYREGYKFIGWSEDFVHVTQNLSVMAQYEPLVSYSVTINYIYSDQTLALQPQIYSLIAGTAMSQIVPSPSIQGFSVDQSSIDIDITNIDKDYIYTVTYTPSPNMTYKVAHYKQNVVLKNPANPMDSVNFHLEETDTLTGTTGESVTASAKVYTGFTAPNTPVTSQIAPDGSTVLNLYYTRNQYTITFDSVGGSFVAPVSYRYGATVTPFTTPAKSGYDFIGWDNSTPTTMPANNLTFTAQWTPSGTVAYTLVYWLENIDGSGYDYIDTHVSNGVAGTTPSVPNTIPSDVIFPIDSTYFTFNTTLTNTNNTSSIAGDGTTVVNVYYQRNTYTLNFNFNAKKYKLLVNGTTYTTSPYKITAKYGAKIDMLWPPAPTLIKTPSEGNFTGWDGAYSYVTKQFYLDSDMVSVPELNATWAKGTTNVTVYYYFENLSGVGYTSEHTQTVAVENGTDTWFAKDFIGFTPIYDETSIVNGIASFDYKRNEYSITFYNGNQVVNIEDGILYEADIESYDTIYVPSRPTNIPNDYIFAGWYTTKEGLVGTEFVFEGATMPPNNVILYARWDKPVFTVTYDYGNGTPSTIQNVVDEGLATAPTEPIRPGYVFDGWYLPSSDMKYTFSFPVTQNLILTAKWIEITTTTYDVVLVKDGLEYSRTTHAGATVNNTIVITAQPLDGYLVDARTKSITLNKTGNVITFYYTPFVSANYTVKYVDDNGVSLVPDKHLNSLKNSISENYVNVSGYYPNYYQQVLMLTSDENRNVLIFTYTRTVPVPYIVRTYKQNLDGSYTVSSQTKMAPAGSLTNEMPVSIEGYLYDPQNSLTSRVVASNGSTVLSLYYVRTTHTIDFSADENGSLSGVTSFSDIKNGELFSNAVTLPTPVPLPGYRFDGWSPVLIADDSQVLTDQSYVATFSKDDALWATITFNGNGTTLGSMPSSGEQLIGSQYTLPSNAYTKDYHTFSSWDESMDGTLATYLDGQTITVTKDMTLYAQWTEHTQYVVNYINNGASGTLSDSNTYYDDQPVTVLDATSLNYPGYRFVGWKALNDTVYQPTDVYNIHANMQLTAMWQYDDTQWTTLQYDKNNLSAQGSMTDDVILKNSTYTLKDNGFAYADYTFVEWNTQADGSGTSYLPGEVVALDVPGLMTLYAIWQENEKYSITYFDNYSDATSIDTPTYANIQHTILQGDTFTVENAFFIYWNTKADGTGITYRAGDLLSISKNVNLYAQWKPSILYTTTYLDGYSSEKLVVEQYGDINDEYNITVSENSFVRVGYTFREWLSNTNQIVMPNDKQTGVYENKTFTAQWDILSYSIKYNLDGGQLLSTNPVSYTTETPTFTLVNPTKSGYTFAGWTVSGEDMSQAQVNKVVSPGTIGNLEFTAHWVYDESQWVSVTFDGNTSTSGMVAVSEKMLIGSEYVIPKNDYIKTNYAYIGWDDSADGTGASYVSGETIRVTKDMTLYAQWSENERFAVTYLNNGATGSQTDTSIYYDNDSVTVKSFGTLKYPGYIFTGWKDANGNVYNENDTLTIHNNVQLTAQWVYDDTQWTTFHYDKNSPNAIGSIQDDTVIRNSDYTLKASNYTLVNYTFVGWNTQSDGSGTLYTADEVINIDIDGIYTLYAQWLEDAKYTINYFANDTTTTSMFDLPEYAGTHKTVLGDTTFSYTNHFFLSWNTMPDGSGTTYQPHQVITPVQDLKLYAQWKASIQYTTTYLDGYSTASFIDVQHGDFYDLIDITVADNTFAREGYTFRDWLSNSNHTYNANDILKDVHSNMTFSAQWDLNEYTISYNLNGGTINGSNPSNYTYETPDFTLINPVLPGYIFRGWTLESQDASLASDNMIVEQGTVGNLAFVANWEYDASQWANVSFDGNASTDGLMPSSSDLLIGSQYKLPSNSFVKHHYTFLYWDALADGSGMSFADGETITITQDITLYAQWHEDARYSISYINNGATGSVTDNTVYYDYDYAKVKGAATLSYPGYTFIGWLDADSVMHLAGEDLEIHTNVQLIAQWQYDASQWTKIKYNKNNNKAIGNMGAESIIRNSDYQLQNNDFTLLNYTFNGWNTATDGSGVSYSVHDVINIDESGEVNLYAMWSENTRYTLNYFANNGTSDTAFDVADYEGVDKTIYSAETFSFDHHYFLNWNTQADGMGTTYHANQLITLSQSLNLYAQWKAFELYTITYQDGYSTGQFVKSEYADISGVIDVNVASSPFTRIGYTFKEWDIIGGGIAHPQDILQDVHDNLTLIAKWTPIEYNITYDLADGLTTVPNPTNYTIESKDFEIAHPVRPGYKFMGWSYNNQNNLSVQMVISEGTVGDIHLVANWAYDESQWSTISFVNSDPSKGDLKGELVYKGIKGMPLGSDTILPDHVSWTNYEWDKWSTSLPATYPDNDLEIIGYWKDAVVYPPVDPPVNPPVDPPVNPPVDPPVNPPVDPPIEANTPDQSNDVYLTKTSVGSLLLPVLLTVSSIVFGAIIITRRKQRR